MTPDPGATRIEVPGVESAWTLRSPVPTPPSRPDVPTSASRRPRLAVISAPPPTAQGVVHMLFSSERVVGVSPGNRSASRAGQIRARQEHVVAAGPHRQAGEAGVEVQAEGGGSAVEVGEAHLPGG